MVNTLRPFLLLSCRKLHEESMMSIPAAYIGVIIIWSTTPLAIQWSGDEVGYLFGITSRMLLGVLTGLLVSVLLRVRLPWHAHARRTYVAAGLGIFFAMLSVYWSSRFIPSGWIAVMFGLAPMITGVLAHYCLPEQALSPARIIGMLLGLAGLAILLLGARTLGTDAALGIAGMVFSVTAYSASAVAIKRIGADIPALATTVGGLAVAVALLLMVYALTATPLPAHIPPRAALSIAYLGIIGSVLGFALYYYVLRRVEPTRVALITLITPALALLLGKLLNDEPIQAQVYAGTAAILSGLLLFEYGKQLGARARLLLALLTRSTPA
jgi:drug/metabolite transporter (DMT)-like permease